jgi:hypothetical protein
VGSDILAQHPFTLDTARGEITFGDLPAGGHVQRVGLFMGSPYLTVELAGQRVPCILDTGANIALLPSETRWPVPVSGERADFDPVFGAFVTPVRRCRARVLDHDLDLDLGEIPAGMQTLLYLTPVQKLINMELLKTGRLGFDLDRRLVAYEPKQ